MQQRLLGQDEDLRACFDRVGTLESSILAGVDASTNPGDERHKAKMGVVSFLFVNMKRKPIHSFVRRKMPRMEAGSSAVITEYLGIVDNFVVQYRRIFKTQPERNSIHVHEPGISECTRYVAHAGGEQRLGFQVLLQLHAVVGSSCVPRTDTDLNIGPWALR